MHTSPLSHFASGAMWYSPTTQLVRTPRFRVLHFSPTADDPAGQAGLYAALVALCTAGILLAEAARESKVRPLPKVCIGLGTLATAYLWIADEAGVHPMNLSLPGSILLLYLLAAAVFSIPLLLIITGGESNWLSRGRSSGKDGDAQ